MIDQEFPREKKTHSDGCVQWTGSDSDDQHLYFTTPSITQDNRYLVILSDRGGIPNLYRIDRLSGELYRLSASTGLQRSYVYPQGENQGLSKVSPVLDAARGWLYWIQDHAVYRVSLAQPRDVERLTEWPLLGVTGYSALDPSGRWLCICSTTTDVFSANDRTQHQQLQHVPLRMVKHGGGTELWIIDTQSGDKRLKARVPFWVTHPHFHPLDPTQLIVNSEGFAALKPDKNYPYWGRLWRIDANGVYTRFLDQRWNRTVIHENWAPDGSELFYHGHSRHTGLRYFEGLAWRVLNRVQHRLGLKTIDCDAHYIEALDPEANPNWTVTTPFPVNHAIGLSARAFIADSRDGYLWHGQSDPNGQFKFQRLRQHGSSYQRQDCHPHPRPTPDGRSVTFNSDVTGTTNVYELAFPSDVLELCSGSESSRSGSTRSETTP